MSANVYSIEDLLVGHHYRSNSANGEIVLAEKDERAVWYGENCESYLVEIRQGVGDYVWRTVAVQTKRNQSVGGFCYNSEITKRKEN